MKTHPFVAAMFLGTLGWAPLTGLSQDEPPSVRSPQALSVRTTNEVNNIANLLKALQNYASIYDGKYPAQIDLLAQKNIVSAVELRKLTTSPLATGALAKSEDGYEYYFVGKGLDAPATDVIILGKYPLAPSDLRRAVGLQDGSVVWWKRAQVEAFLKKMQKSK